MKWMPAFLRKLSVTRDAEGIPILWTDVAWAALEVCCFIWRENRVLAILAAAARLLLWLPLLDRSLWEKAYSPKYDWGCGNPEEIRKKRDPYRFTVWNRLLLIFAGLLQFLRSV